jgi:hypothetical protein
MRIDFHILLGMEFMFLLAMDCRILPISLGSFVLFIGPQVFAIKVSVRLA